MGNILKSNWFNILIVVAAAVFGCFMYPSLPEKIAMRFNWGGEPHGYMDKTLGIWILPGLVTFTIFLVPILVRISPAGYQMSQSWRSIGKINLAIAFSLSALHVGIILTNVDSTKYPIFPFLNLTCISLLILFGNFLSKLEKNFFVGIRTPWSLISERNWFATHRFGAKVCVASGLILTIAALFGVSFVVVLIGFIVALFSPFFYSFWYHRTFERISQ